MRGLWRLSDYCPPFPVRKRVHSLSFSYFNSDGDEFRETTKQKRRMSLAFSNGGGLNKLGSDHDAKRCFSNSMSSAMEWDSLSSIATYYPCNVRVRRRRYCSTSVYENDWSKRKEGTELSKSFSILSDSRDAAIKKDLIPEVRHITNINKNHLFHSYRAMSSSREGSPPKSSLSSNTCFTYTNLPISPRVLESISILPEVRDAIESIHSASLSTIQSKFLPELERALEVFSHSPATQMERRAVLLIQAEMHSMVGLHTRASKIYDILLKECSREIHSNSEEFKNSLLQSSLPSVQIENVSWIKLAQAKAGFFGGNSQQSKTLCQSVQSNFEKEADALSSIAQGCCLVGEGLSELLQAMEGVALEDEGNEKRCATSLHTSLNLLQLASDNLLNEATNRYGALNSNDEGTTNDKSDSLHSATYLAMTVAMNNLGIVQALKEPTLQSRSASSLESVDTWNKALGILNHVNGKEQSPTPMVASLRARLNANITWRLLAEIEYTEMSENDPILQRATTHAKQALKLYEMITKEKEKGDITNIRPAMGQALSLLATCYARAGSAVTAEGLFQTAMDYVLKDECGAKQKILPGLPLSTFLLRDVFERYAMLLDGYDVDGSHKRNADAKTRRQEATDRIQRMVCKSHYESSSLWLSPLRTHKTCICAGLWFPHPADFVQ